VLCVVTNFSVTQDQGLQECHNFIKSKKVKRFIKRFRPSSATVVTAEPFSHGTGTRWCLQKEMATYRHWSVSLWRNPDDVSHCRILSRQNWMAPYLGYTLLMKTLFRGWPIMVNDTHTRRRRSRAYCIFTLWPLYDKTATLQSTSLHLQLHHFTHCWQKTDAYCPLYETGHEIFNITQASVG